ncbi:MAG: hypothetical protein DYH00_05665 [Bacteroidetes bacterium CHB6]|nr:hypothetical protein [Bacteroidetes bacterium CHB6]
MMVGLAFQKVSFFSPIVSYIPLSFLREDFSGFMCRIKIEFERKHKEFFRELTFYMITVICPDSNYSRQFVF